MPTTGLMKREHGFVEPARHRSVLERVVGENQGRFLKHKARHSASGGDGEDLWDVGGTALGTTAGGLVVGLVQGHFGTSKIGGVVPAELVAGVVLHGVAFTQFAKPLRPVLRALGNGMFAAGAATAGYGLLAKRQPPSLPGTAPARSGMRGSPEPETGGAALSDVELARFANRR